MRYKPGSGPRCGGNRNRAVGGSRIPYGSGGTMRNTLLWATRHRDIEGLYYVGGFDDFYLDLLGSQCITHHGEQQQGAREANAHPTTATSEHDRNDSLQLSFVSNRPTRRIVAHSLTTFTTNNKLRSGRAAVSLA